MTNPSIADAPVDVSDVPDENATKPLLIRDPVHDLIRIECPYARRLIQSEPFQRLRRIKQLGLADMVYPGAEHSRLNHSLGVYHLAHRAMDAIDQNLKAMGKAPKFDPNDQGAGGGKHHRLLLGLCALLHDVGHGPFSHMFERVAKEFLKGAAKSHEDWTITIFQTHAQVRKILDDAATHLGVPELIDQMKQVIKGLYTPDYIVHLLSSQMDVDRFDYLIRDSRNAGCHYGDFDINWIFRCMFVLETQASEMGRATDPENGNQNTPREVLVIHDSKGRNSVEQYILGRHYMYVHLYYHRTITGAEALLQRILKCAVEVMKKNPEALSPASHGVLGSFAEGKNPEMDEYLRADDHVIHGWVSGWSRGDHNDPTLADLCRRFMNRDLFAKIEPPKGNLLESMKVFEELQKRMRDSGFEPDYYLLQTDMSDTAFKDAEYYDDKNKNDEPQDIYFYNPSKPTKLVKLSNMREKSVVIAGLASLKFKDTAWYVPREFRDEAEKIIRQSH